MVLGTEGLTSLGLNRKRRGYIERVGGIAPDRFLLLVLRGSLLDVCCGRPLDIRGEEVVVGGRGGLVSVHSLCPSSCDIVDACDMRQLLLSFCRQESFF